MLGVPEELARADPLVVRPVDLRARYANPAKELRRLARGGALLRLSHGYYSVVPEEYRGTAWRPSAEAAGLAIGRADYGTDHVAVMGVSSARLLGAVPRALAAGGDRGVGTATAAGDDGRLHPVRGPKGP